MKLANSALQANGVEKMPTALTVSIDEATVGALDDLAAKTERSRDWLVNRAIEDFVALNAWQITKIEAGMAAADRGEFTTDAEIARVREKFAVSR
jgi:predicted transcriptional regulator